MEPSDSFRDSLATLDQEGNRKWIYPKQPKGGYYTARGIVSYLLIAFFVSAPFIYLNGEQLLLFNLIERKFVIFGGIFHPHDFYLFMLAMAIGVIGIGIFTLLFGRLFCGWVCPQTIFMEMLFRKIEYLIEGSASEQQILNKAPLSASKFAKKALKHSIFFALSFFIANIFLSYIIGSTEVLKIASEPVGQHLIGFLLILLFSFVFYGVFAYLREQVCTSICPYGRLQGVLMDKYSLVVAYDYNRGETRGKIKKNEDRKVALKGDCIDCNQCVQVCPTGIDIRNGTQLECTNCTACIDACNRMMEAVNLETGLIRYTSEHALQHKEPFSFHKRIWLFGTILVVLISIFTYLLFARNAVEITIMRTPGQLSQVMPNEQIANAFNYTLYNKTNRNIEITVKLENIQGTIQLVGTESLALPNEGHVKGTFLVIIDKSVVPNKSTPIVIGVYGEGKKLDEFRTSFISK